MKYSLILLASALLLISSCGKKETTTAFSAVDHYSLELKEFDLKPILETPRQELTGAQKILGDLILYEAPLSVADTSFVKPLTTLGLKKKNIASQKLAQLTQLLSPELPKPENKVNTQKKGTVYTDILTCRVKNNIQVILKMDRNSGNSELINEQGKFINTVPKTDISDLVTLLKK